MYSRTSRDGFFRNWDVVHFDCAEEQLGGVMVGDGARVTGSGTDGVLTATPGLLETTFDQLRTLLLVSETGSALGAARVLGREQSSVQKQLDTLNRNFQDMCGELLVVRQGRGQPFLFTPTGQQVVELARSTLETWLASVNDARRRLGQTVAVGTTEFTLTLLGRVWQRVADDFAAREVELNVLHVRTKDAFARLDSKEVDLMCCGLASETGRADVPAQYEFLEWQREGLVLLSNLSRREMSAKPVSVERLTSIPLVIPSGGVIVDFLRRWYGTEYRGRLRVVAIIDDIYYGLALLRSGMANGCMVVSETIGRAAVDGRLPSSPDFRLVSFAGDFSPMLQLVTGVFGRRGERQQYEATHPLNLLWDAFADETRTGTPASL